MVATVRNHSSQPYCIHEKMSLWEVDLLGSGTVRVDFVDLYTSVVIKTKNSFHTYN